MVNKKNIFLLKEPKNIESTAKIVNKNDEKMLPEGSSKEISISKEQTSLKQQTCPKSNEEEKGLLF